MSMTIIDQKEYDFLTDDDFLTQEIIIGKLLHSTSQEGGSNELIGKTIRPRTNPLYLLYLSRKILLIEEIPFEFLTVEKFKNSMVKFKELKGFVPWESEYFNFPQVERGALTLLKFAK